ncbi:MAG TPA: hypothetical protein VMU51_22480 [Mycobacteriales bacterium]|nr:hypothetical protein [Mycobacteriales bacterium]
MGLQVELVDPVREPVPAQWDEFVAGQRLLPLWRSTLLTTSAWCAQTPIVLAIVRDPTGVPVALFHARLVGLPVNPTRYLGPRHLGPRPVAPVGAVECRLSPASVLPGVAFAAELDEPGRSAAVRAFERAARHRFGWRCLAVAYRHLTAADLPLVRRRGRLVVETDPPMVLRNQWADPADYLRWLPARWSARLRRINEDIEADPGVTVSVGRSVPAVPAISLLQAVRRRHQSRLLIRPPVPARYLDQLGGLPGTRFVTYTDPAGRLLAFGALHESRDGLLSTFWGNRDRADGGLPNLYFDHYLRAVRLMVAGGHACFSFGKGLREIKERYGAEPVACYSVAGR